MSGMYDAQFYDVIRDGAVASVNATMPHLIELLGVTQGLRVLDVGCGEGWWAHGFATHGCDVTGVDYGQTEHRPSTFTFIEQSLMEPLPEGDWDLIVCLEVAEHLPHRRMETLFAEFADRAPDILFSAARPGQGGTGHINEQPFDFWTQHLEAVGYEVSGALRWHLWGDPEIENWYQQNMLVGMQAPGGPLFDCDPLLVKPHDVVHPILFDARR